MQLVIAAGISLTGSSFPQKTKRGSSVFRKLPRLVFWLANPQRRKGWIAAPERA
jgi:hypothetical protein